MYKWLSLVFAVVGIACIVGYHVSAAAGVPKADLRPLRIAFIAVFGLWMAVWLGRFFVRRTDPPRSDPPKDPSN
jgi:hypothetical protein